MNKIKKGADMGNKIEVSKEISSWFECYKNADPKLDPNEPGDLLEPFKDRHKSGLAQAAKKIDGIFSGKIDPAQVIEYKNILSRLVKYSYLGYCDVDWNKFLSLPNNIELIKSMILAKNIVRAQFPYADKTVEDAERQR